MLHASATCRRTARLSSMIGAQNIAWYEHLVCLVTFVNVLRPVQLPSGASKQCGSAASLEHGTRRTPKCTRAFCGYE